MTTRYVFLRNDLQKNCEKISDLFTHMCYTHNKN